MNRRVITVVFCLTFGSLNCQSGASPSQANNGAVNGVVPTYGYEVVNVFPHDPEAFTQGLEYHDGKLFESTGEEGRSSLRQVDLESGKVIKKVDVPPPYFAEGITLYDGKIYQLTWQHQVGFTYDANSFEKLGTFAYRGEGWGLTNDKHLLILSDGTNRLRFFAPATFQMQRSIPVVDGQTPINELNELEYVQGQIYANIWHNDRIAIINPQTGQVTAWLDLKGLLPPNQVTSEEAVLNGIAYDEAGDRLFVTGKLWPKLFQIRVKK
ncbi:MAG TPA: glutaminyl-peptide cyclotransferase [Pyrinomonadaceae bacterium]|nr:glutaminyl-peptide cyclotransferase [Pyrinomonadaceae bacterium]